MSLREVPQLSIVVASQYSVHDLEEFLENLLRQRHGREVEIIVADSCGGDSVGGDAGLDEIITRYPEVIFIRYSEQATLPVLLGAGIARASGPVIAVTNTQCVVGDGWITATLEAHKSQHPVIGGAVEAPEYQTLVDWAAYFCDYGQFMRPLQQGAVNELPGNNISFKKWALGFGPEFARDEFWKTYWCGKLQAEGFELISAPSMVVYYKKSYRLIPYLIHRFHNGRCFAGMRIAQVSPTARVGYLFGSSLLPFLFLARLFKMILRKRRWLGKFIFSLPFSLLAIISWSLGEFCGYLTGKGRSCARTY